MPQKWIDISPLITPKLAVWPGDVPFKRDVSMATAKGQHMDLSSITTTLHVGAHADAPSHYEADAPGIDAVDLGPYMGPCVVHSVLNKKAIEKKDCEALAKVKPQRVLFKTQSYRNLENFNQDFSYFTAEALDFLAALGVKLVGIDTPSVDPFDSKTLDAHHALYRHQIRNLEGLVLEHVPDGPYKLIALPLRIAGADASPVRAILVQE